MSALKPQTTRDDGNKLNNSFCSNINSVGFILYFHSHLQKRINHETAITEIINHI
jgi:hypothetical protein